jgi:hypothetical protein
VTDNVPSAIPVEYNGHYTVLGKLDVTEGLEPTTRHKGFYLFGHLEVVSVMLGVTAQGHPAQGQTETTTNLGRGWPHRY